MCFLFIADGATEKLGNGHVAWDTFGVGAVENHFHLLLARASISEMQLVIKAVSWKFGSKIQMADIDGCDS